MDEREDGHRYCAQCRRAKPAKEFIVYKTVKRVDPVTGTTPRMVTKRMMVDDCKECREWGA